MKVLVVDIDGTYIKYACIDEYMKMEQRGKIFTPQEGRTELIEAIARLYEAVGDAEGIAISMPGIIDSENGYCYMGGALRYNDDFYFRHTLYERCKTKIHIENNAKCAAMAEAAVGSLMDTADGFVLIFSTMIGGGYIKDHHIYKGKHFAAGEVSYIILNSGNKLTDENFWGRSFGIPKLLERYSKVKEMDIETVDLLTIFDAIKKADSEAIDCLQWYTQEIAVRIFNIQTVLDVEKFALGGELLSYPLFMEYVKKNLNKLYAECPFHVPKADIVNCKFSEEANLIGALQCYLTNYI